MASKIEGYRQVLRTLADWQPYLLSESGLPGPRGNIELGQAVADLGTPEQFEHLLSFTPEIAPVNSPYEFLAFCGVIGLGRLIAEGQLELFSRLRAYASDPRWRIREGVAMALQRVGDVDLDLLLSEMEAWQDGTWLEMRAAAAAVAEPRLLKQEAHARRALDIMDHITSRLTLAQDRKTEDFKVLRQGLGYTWSVVVAALPQVGMPMMDKWIESHDPDVNWVMRENLKKKRLSGLEPWVSQKLTKTSEKS